MSSYLSKILGVLLFSLLIIVAYYIVPAHRESFDGYLVYSILIGIIYASYKGLQLFNQESKISFTPIGIGGFFLLHLFILCGMFFSLNGDVFSAGVVLFFSIFAYMLIPIIIVFTILSLGKYIYDRFLGDVGENNIFEFLISLSLGFTSFISALAVLGFFGLYNIWIVMLLLIISGIISYKQIWNYLVGIFNYKISFDSHSAGSNPLEKLNTRLLTAELFFIIITLLLSVNLISIMRPFPIGWDDLGAYMNFPRLMAAGGEVGFLGSMMSWQTFTGIGYLSLGPVQAFFLNNIGGFLSVIVLMLIVSDILSLQSNKRTFIHIPSLVAMLFITMPMIVFQQAKDMKIDPGLFFVSVIGVYLLYKIVVGNYEKIIKYKLYVILGIIIGFAFTIKFTSLLTIIAIIGVIVFRYTSWIGLLGYFAIFVGMFTKLGLWTKMNVIYPKDDLFFVNSLSLVCLILFFACFGYLISKNIKNIKKLGIFVMLFLVGVFVSVSPWVINNISRADNINVSTILSGKPDKYKPDFSLILDSQTLNQIEDNNVALRGQTTSGVTTNEDYGRYLGYEKGINNYLKLPWNLTMQINQGGEFTDIGWLFLAFIPGLFLFLPNRKKYFIPFIFLSLVSVIALNFYKPSVTFLTDVFSQITLPTGYGVILLIFIFSLIVTVLGINTEKKYMRLFMFNLIFSSIYMFLWTISAFGIVWYGIVMYFNMLLMMAVCLYYVSKYDVGDNKKSTSIRFFGTMVITTLVGIWLFNSVLPHTFKNLKAAAYEEFKKGEINTVNSPFLYHKDYGPILFELNIGSENLEKIIRNNVDDIFIQNTPQILTGNIVDVTNLLNQVKRTPNIDTSLYASADRSLNNIYAQILQPDTDVINQKYIYRVGTFLKYFISQNNSRLYEDSLLKKFDTYFYDQDKDVSLERMKKVGLSYLLVDLNAATIDQDPEKNLTQRVENMFELFTSDKVELVETDSICLRVGLDVYRQEGNLDDYLMISTVNHNSNFANRNQKFATCYNIISQIFLQDVVSQENYSYLLPIKYYLDNNNITDEKEILGVIQKNISFGYKALFKIK